MGGPAGGAAVEMKKGIDDAGRARLLGAGRWEGSVTAGGTTS